MAAVKESLRQVKEGKFKQLPGLTNKLDMTLLLLNWWKHMGPQPKSAMQQNYPRYLLCGLVYLAETMSLLVQ